VRRAATVAAILVAGGLAAAAGAQPTVLPNLNGKWTLHNQRSSVWTVKVVGDVVTAYRMGAPGHPKLVSSFNGLLYDFGPYAIVQGLLKITGEGAPVTNNMCWTIRSVARPTEFQWGDCEKQLGTFIRVTAGSTPSKNTPSNQKTAAAPAGRPNTSPTFTNFGPVFRG
jgi:hypothetical protein